DPARLRKMYKEKFEKGKKVAEQWRQEQKAKKDAAEEEEIITATTTASATETPAATVEEDNTSTPEPNNAEILDRLRELASLKEKGILSEEEFEMMKKKLIDSF
ncbi:MAG: SHOCT domain-containing protein, partial [Bacteroidota bacterium]